jgi:glycosyltransferase involved in cell wall biosynthesis
MSSDVSLMMVTFNRRPLTERTLEGLSKSIDCDYNLIIVDNGSKDGTVEYLDGLVKDHSWLPYLQQLIVHKNTENKGIAAGRNRGLLIADELHTKWYCTLDNDILIPNGALSECIDILKTVPSYGMVGVNFEGVDYPLVTINGKTFQDKSRGNLGTAFIVFKKQIHQAIGFFKIYNRYGLDDADYCMRARVFNNVKMGYIERMGTHLGVGELDSGEYRKFKTIQHDSKVKEFQQNCALYYARKLPIYVKFSE